jgi:lipoprotein-anchoring transpeptidase ErfK/SrfK
MQLALARQGISPGSLDGVLGSQTRAALRAFQQKENLPVTGEWDPPTRSRLLLAAPPLTTYLVTTNDLARLLPLGATWLVKSQQERLDYETVLELVAEKSRTHPGFIRQLNPTIDWTNIVAGAIVQVPNAEMSSARDKAAFARIHLDGRTLQVFDSGTNLLTHFPCSIARQVEKRPVGELFVSVIASNPDYTFDPDNFPESSEARQLKGKLVLKPGPNNPVGTVWIGLDRPGYGIHGTPRPEEVGRTESHGCFRLANWNAEYLKNLSWVGMPVFVEP